MKAWVGEYLDMSRSTLLTRLGSCDSCDFDLVSGPDVNASGCGCSVLRFFGGGVVGYLPATCRQQILDCNKMLHI